MDEAEQSFQVKEEHEEVWAESRSNNHLLWDHNKNWNWNKYYGSLLMSRIVWNEMWLRDPGRFFQASSFRSNRKLTLEFIKMSKKWNDAGSVCLICCGSQICNHHPSAPSDLCSPHTHTHTLCCSSFEYPVMCFLVSILRTHSSCMCPDMLLNMTLTVRLFTHISLLFKNKQHSGHFQFNVILFQRAVSWGGKSRRPYQDDSSSGDHNLFYTTFIKMYHYIFCILSSEVKFCFFILPKQTFQSRLNHSALFLDMQGKAQSPHHHSLL